MKWIRTILAAFSLGALLTCVPWLRTTEAHNPITTTYSSPRGGADPQREVRAVPQGQWPVHAASDFRPGPPWAIAIKEEILARQMPPWPAERGYGAFANDGGLTLRERSSLSPGSTVERREARASLRMSWITAVTGCSARRRTAIARRQLSHHPCLATSATSSVRDSPRQRLCRALDFKPGDSHARAAFYTLAGTGSIWAAGRQRIPPPSSRSHQPCACRRTRECSSTCWPRVRTVGTRTRARPLRC